MRKQKDMRKIFNKAIKNPLISGGIVVFIGNFSGNILNFLFNFFMTRNLSVSDYGTMVSLASVILLLALAADSLVPSVMRFAGSYFAKKQVAKAREFFWKLNNVSFMFSGVLLAAFIVFNKSIGSFLKINDSFLIFITGLSVFMLFLTALNRGMILAKLSFYYISFLSFFNSALKFVSGIVLVLFGMGARGALLAFFLAYLVNYVLTFFSLRFVFNRKTTEAVVSIKKIASYGLPSAFAMIGITLFITTDIMLVKHFYPAKEAGIYAGMSLLGKIIFFFSAPVAHVLFPLVVQKRARNESYNNLFFIAFVFVLISSLGIIGFYFLFSEFSIRTLLKQEEYLAIKSILWIFGIYMMLHSLLSLVVNYYLSIQKTIVFVPVIVAALFQALGIWFYHGSFPTIIIVSMISITIPLVLTLVHYGITYGKIKGQ